MNTPTPVGLPARGTPSAGFGGQATQPELEVSEAVAQIVANDQFAMEGERQMARTILALYKLLMQKGR